MKNIPVFVIVACLFFTACSSGVASPDKIAPRKPVSSYKLAVIEKSGVLTTVKLPGQLTAYQEVSIFPKVNGYVKTIAVDMGSKVVKGQMLMILEAPELEQAAMTAKEKYAHAKADYSLDKERYHRLLEASATEGAVSPLDLSTLRSKMEADSALANAEKSNWQQQETMLSYLKVTAPFNGIITERNIHPGALVSVAEKNSPLLVLKQIDHLRLQVDVPEGISSSIRSKDTISFYTSAFPGRRMPGHISRMSMNVNAQYRSERIEVDVDNQKENLSPGMYADVILYSKGNAEAFSVPRSAVVISTERKYVVVVREGKALKLDVSTGNLSSVKAEIFGNILSGDKIVVNPDDEIKEGEKIQL